ncbi:hypothetical protein GCM10009001_22230 [Virgibacillus siamensis]|uniref:DUF4183 domain-containing protein n=1 Tax=Virgibacillus siamensis TaxID=480071 RepID=A0ABN1G5N0_9BACI
MNEKQYRYYKGTKAPCDRHLYPQCRCHHCDKESREVKNGIEISPTNTNTFNPIFSPSITINVSSGYTPAPIGVETVQYIAFAEEGKKIYTNKDALKQYGSSDILDPNDVSNINLFVNGLLQPPSIYDIEEGTLYLKSSDSPPKDAPVILLFVIVTG